MDPYTKKISLFSVIFLAVAVLGISGTISCHQQVLSDTGNAAVLPHAPRDRISAKYLLKADPEPRSHASPEPATPMPAVAKHHRLSRSYNPIILRAADAFAIDPALLKAVIMAESRYNPKAVSKRGARGLMQLMPATARALGVTDIFDPEDNIYGGALYLKRLMDQFNGDIELALAAYNAGSRKVKKYGGVPPFKQTRYYIHKVMKYRQLFKEEA